MSDFSLNFLFYTSLFSFGVFNISLVYYFSSGINGRLVDKLLLKERFLINYKLGLV